MVGTRILRRQIKGSRRFVRSQASNVRNLRKKARKTFRRQGKSVARSTRRIVTGRR